MGKVSSSWILRRNQIQAENLPANILMALMLKWGLSRFLEPGFALWLDDQQSRVEVMLRDFQGQVTRGDGAFSWFFCSLNHDIRILKLPYCEETQDTWTWRNTDKPPSLCPACFPIHRVHEHNKIVILRPLSFRVAFNAAKYNWNGCWSSWLGIRPLNCLSQTEPDMSTSQVWGWCWSFQQAGGSQQIIVSHRSRRPYPCLLACSLENRDLYCQVNRKVLHGLHCLFLIKIIKPLC